MEKIASAFSEKESLSANIGMIQSQINKLFADRKNLKETQAVAEDFHESERIIEKVARIDDEIRNLNKQYNTHVNDLEASEAKFQTIRKDYLKALYKDVSKRWDELKEIAKKADAINDELSQMGEFAHRYTGVYMVRAEPFHKNFTQNAERNLDTLKRHAIPD